MISYKPLFRLLLEKDMTKTQLREAVGFSSATLAKMSKGEYISLETVENICKYLDCKIENVIEILWLIHLKIEENGCMYAKKLLIFKNLKKLNNCSICDIISMLPKTRYNYND